MFPLFLLLLLFATVASADRFPDAEPRCALQCTKHHDCVKQLTRGTLYTIKCRQAKYMRLDDEYLPSTQMWCRAREQSSTWSDREWPNEVRVRRSPKEMECVKEVPCRETLTSSCRGSATCTELILHESRRSYDCDPGESIYLTRPNETTVLHLARLDCTEDGAWRGFATVKESIGSRFAPEEGLPVPAFSNVRCVRKLGEGEKDDFEAPAAWVQALKNEAKKKEKQYWCIVGIVFLLLISATTGAVGARKLANWRRRIMILKEIQPVAEEDRPPQEADAKPLSECEEWTQPDQCDTAITIGNPEDAPKKKKNRRPLLEEDMETMVVLDKYYVQEERRANNVEDFSEDDLEDSKRRAIPTMHRQTIYRSSGRPRISRQKVTDRARTVSRKMASKQQQSGVLSQQSGVLSQQSGLISEGKED